MVLMFLTAGFDVFDDFARRFLFLKAVLRPTP